MNAKQFTLCIASAVITLSVVLAGCSPAPASSATFETSAAAPEEVVERFYDWYVGEPGSKLADAAYRSSERLAAEFVQQVDEIIASFDKGGYDPFLCAQDVPGSFTVGEAVVSGEEATVVVHEVWNPGTEYESVHDVEVTLRKVDGAWKIAGIACAAPEAAAMAPEEVVRGFYDWYLGYIGDPAAEEMRNPLVDGAYRSSEYLTEGFVQRVDEIIASFDKGGYDPFLCAQDIPRSFTVDVAEVFGDEASVVVHQLWNPGTEYESARDVKVALRTVDGAWKIADVTCAMPESASPTPEGPMPVTPEGAVEGFYGWYLWYAQNAGNPLVDGAYRSSEYLTEAFMQQVDELIASFDKGGYDPFLCAQDVPESFTLGEVVGSEDQASVVVQTSFESHAFTVELSEVDGWWAISDVVCAEPGAGDQEPAAAPEAPQGEANVADWQVFADAEYGFRLRYPEDWTYEDIPPVPEGMEAPEGMKALKRVLVFAPRGWDGVAPPLGVEVTDGTEEEFGRVYAPPSSTEDVEIGGRPVVRTMEDLSTAHIVHYIFHSPADEIVRVVVTDAISGFPDRVEGHGDVVEIVGQILPTVEFIQ